jgi:hypothetical protein
VAPFAATAELVQTTIGSKKLPWVIAGVLLVAIVGILAYQAGGTAEKKKAEGSNPATLSATPTTATAPVAEPAKAPAPVAEPAKTVEAAKLTNNISIVSVPTGATVMRNNKPLGITPISLPRPNKGTIDSLILKRDGYQSTAVDLSPSCSSTRIVTLEKAPEPAKKVIKKKTLRKKKSKKKPLFVQ